MDGPRLADLIAIAKRLGIAFTRAEAPAERWLRSPDGLRLHALDWGDHGHAVLLLHGGALSARTWDYVALGTRSKYRMIALDMRGHGESDWANDYRIELAVADALAVLDALSLERAHIVGMSLGGLVGAEFAFAHADRASSLTLIDVGPGSSFEASARMRGFVNDFTDAGSIEEVVEAAMRVNARSDPERLRYRMQALLKKAENGRWVWKRDPRRVADYPEIVRRIESLSRGAAHFARPFMIVRGSRSKMISSQAAAAFAGSFPNGCWVEVSGAGHNVQEDNPAELIRVLRRFWAAVDMPLASS